MTSTASRRWKTEKSQILLLSFKQCFKTTYFPTKPIFQQNLSIFINMLFLWCNYTSYNLSWGQMRWQINLTPLSWPAIHLVLRRQYCYLHWSYFSALNPIWLLSDVQQESSKHFWGLHLMIIQMNRTQWYPVIVFTSSAVQCKCQLAKQLLWG